MSSKTMTLLMLERGCRGVFSVWLEKHSCCPARQNTSGWVQKQGGGFTVWSTSHFSNSDFTKQTTCSVSAADHLHPSTGDRFWSSSWMIQRWSQVRDQEVVGLILETFSPAEILKPLHVVYYPGKPPGDHQWPEEQLLSSLLVQVKEPLVTLRRSWPTV